MTKDQMLLVFLDEIEAARKVYTLRQLAEHFKCSVPEVMLMHKHLRELKAGIPVTNRKSRTLLFAMIVYAKTNRQKFFTLEDVIKAV